MHLSTTVSRKTVFFVLSFVLFTVMGFAQPSSQETQFRFEELLARFQARKNSRVLEAEKHGLALPSSKSPQIQPISIPAPASIEIAPSADASIQTGVPETSSSITDAPSTSAHQENTAREIPTVSSIPDSFTLKSSQKEGTASSMPFESPQETICAPVSQDQIPLVHTHTPDQPCNSEISSQSEKEKASFENVLIRMQLHQSRRQKEAAKMKISLPSNSGTIASASPSLAKMNSALKEILNRTPSSPTLIS